jgi:hemolysin activation/secretion protein
MSTTCRHRMLSCVSRRLPSAAGPAGARRSRIAFFTALIVATAGPNITTAAAIKRIELVSGAGSAHPLRLTDVAVLESSLDAFRGHPDNAVVREAIADAVLQHYQSAGWPVVDVSVEKAERGLVRVHVAEGRYGYIAVTGGSMGMRDAVFADWSRLQGAPLTSESIADGLAWLHRNPLRTATISFEPGAEPATADATLTLQGNNAVRLSAGFRDDGSPPLDRERFFVRLEEADAFGLPSWWYLEDISGADRDEYHGASGALRLFLPSHRELRLGGYWTHAESTTALPGFEFVSELEAWNISLRWVVPLPSWRGWRSDVSTGAEFIRLDSAVQTGGTGVSGSADALHLTAGLHAERRSGPWRSGLDAEAAWSPGGATDDADDAHHETLRRGASADYTLVRAGAWSEKTMTGGWTATGKLSGQWTSDPVVPVQEFSPAGAYGVRGFPASSAIGDSGVQGSVEILTPSLPLPVSLTNLHIRAAAFLDAAHVHDAVTGNDESLASTGTGLRLQWRDSFGMAVDYGWRLSEPGGRLHLSLRMEF